MGTSSGIQAEQAPAAKLGQTARCANGQAARREQGISLAEGDSEDMQGVSRGRTRGPGELSPTRSDETTQCKSRGGGSWQRAAHSWGCHSAVWR